MPDYSFRTALYAPGGSYTGAQCAAEVAGKGSEWVDQSEAKQKEFRQHELAQYIDILRQAIVIRGDAALMAELRDYMIQQRHDVANILAEIFG